jgi:phosphatidylglycerol:prolipoprotein diacylglycerol transferase
MRSRIIEFLNHYFNTSIFDYLIPDHAYVYAAMFGIGAWVFIRRCRSISLNMYHASGLLIWAGVAALIGARVFYLLQHVGDVIKDPSMLLELNGATVSFGVYLGSFLGIFLYTVRHHLVPWEYMDVLAATLGLGPMLGRLACFLNGDDYGTLSTLPWAVSFPHHSYPFMNQVELGLIQSNADLSMPIHPVQLYASLKGLVLFVLFSALWRKKLFKPGALFFLFWITYAVCRFLLEFFRGDADRGWVGVFSTGQFMSILLFMTSLVFIGALYKWKIMKREEIPFSGVQMKIG